MEKTTRTFICDIDGCENSSTDLSPDKMIHKNIQVIFTTEQTEGKSSHPYLDFKNVHICKECFSKILEGNAVYGYGAQGNNTYYFKNEQ